jgi:hypothetical protein
MAIADRALRAFECELVKHITFTYTVMRAFDSAGSPRTRLRMWMRNNSNIALTSLRGSIGPGESVSFRYTTFHVERLAPGAEVEIARIEATISGPVERRFENLATVNVSGSVDLATFRFKDTSRNATYVAAHVAVEAATTPLTLERSSARTDRAIPLSDLDETDRPAEKRSA